MEPYATRRHELNYRYQDFKLNSMSIANSKIGIYMVYELIGRGAFGSVYRGINEITKKPVAVKLIDLELVQKEPNPNIKQIRRRLCKTEPDLMMSCDSDNIVKCYDVYQNASLEIIVMEFCGNGTLQDQINQKKKIPEQETIIILKQIFNGVAELHRQCIVHRDLKAENILISNGVYKIADLGFSKVLDFSRGEQLKATTLGTISTMAPEVINRQPYGLKADIWSVGVIFFQIVFGKLPFTSNSAHAVFGQIIASKKLLVNDRITYNNYTASKEVTDFLKLVLVVDSKARLGWESLVKHEIFFERDTRLDSEFRLNFKLAIPKEQLKFEEIIPEVDEEHFKQNQLISPAISEKLIRLTRQEANLKYNELNDQDTKAYNWAKETHLQCLKTELILEDIVHPIQNNKMLNLEDRRNIQFMYLLCTRCLNNISIINDQANKFAKSEIVKNLFQSVKRLYYNVTQSWNIYSKKLTATQNELSSIVADRFRKIFKSEEIQEKDKFLVGIEHVQYNKSDQIEYTMKYISDIVQIGFVTFGKNGLRLRKLLENYQKICAITLEDLVVRKFKQAINEMMK